MSDRFENITISSHAKRQLRKRLGIPRASIEGVVLEAVENGTWRKDISGSLRRYLDWLVRKEDAPATEAIVHHRYVFLIGYNQVITGWLLPKKYKNRKAAA